MDLGAITFVRSSELEDRLGITRQTLKNWSDRGLMPKAQKLSRNINVWNRKEIEEFLMLGPEAWRKAHCKPKTRRKC